MSPARTASFGLYHLKFPLLDAFDRLFPEVSIFAGQLAKLQLVRLIPRENFSTELSISSRYASLLSVALGVGIFIATSPESVRDDFALVFTSGILSTRFVKNGILSKEMFPSISPTIIFCGSPPTWGCLSFTVSLSYIKVAPIPTFLLNS